MLSQEAPRAASVPQSVKVASQADLAGGVASDQFLNVNDIAFVEIGAPDILPTRSFAGPLSDGMHVLIAAQAEPDAIREILSQVDLAGLDDLSAPAAKDGSESRSRRKRR